VTSPKESSTVNDDFIVIKTRECQGRILPLLSLTVIIRLSLLGMRVSYFANHRIGVSWKLQKYLFSILFLLLVISVK
jgi:hypothetical protein